MKINSFGYKTSRKASPSEIGCFFTIAGIIVFLIGEFMLINNFLFLPGSISTDGTIISCTMIGKHKDTCQPTTRFKTPQGESITFQESYGSSNFSQGDSVTVRYHLNTPHDARIYSLLDTWFLPISLNVLGLIFLWIGFRYVPRAFRKTLDYFQGKPMDYH